MKKKLNRINNWVQFLNENKLSYNSIKPIECYWGVRRLPAFVFNFDNFSLIMLSSSEGTIDILSRRSDTGVYISDDKTFNDVKHGEDISKKIPNDWFYQDEGILYVLRDKIKKIDNENKLKGLFFGGENHEWGDSDGDELSQDLLKKYPILKGSNKIIDDYHYSISIFNKCSFFYDGDSFNSPPFIFIFNNGVGEIIYV